MGAPTLTECELKKGRTSKADRRRSPTGRKRTPRELRLENREKNIKKSLMLGSGAAENSREMRAEKRPLDLAMVRSLVTLDRGQVGIKIIMSESSH